MYLGVQGADLMWMSRHVAASSWLSVQGPRPSPARKLRLDQTPSSDDDSQRIDWDSVLALLPRILLVSRLNESGSEDLGMSRDRHCIGMQVPHTLKFSCCAQEQL